VVVFVHRDETGKITISFKSGINQISNNGFNRVIDEKLILAKISEVNWSETIKEVMNKNKTTIVKQGFASKASAADPEIQKSLTDYFVKSSQIELSDDPMLTLRAFADFQKGGFKKLEELINSYQKGYDELKKISFPQEAKEFHENSINILEGLISSFQDLRNKKISLDEFLSSQKMKSVENLTTQTVVIFNDLVNKYGLNLPESVL
jgi:hypothetical protein